MPKYIGQYPTWPNFTWNQALLEKPLLHAKKSQAFIVTQTNLLDSRDEMEFFIEEAYTTSAIEGEILDREAIRSSVAKRLGLETPGMPELQKKQLK